MVFTRLCNRVDRQLWGNPRNPSKTPKIPQKPIESVNDFRDYSATAADPQFRESKFRDGSSVIRGKERKLNLMDRLLLQFMNV